MALFTSCTCFFLSPRAYSPSLPSPAHRQASLVTCPCRSTRRHRIRVLPSARPLLLHYCHTRPPSLLLLRGRPQTGSPPHAAAALQKASSTVVA
jgi:hypothetical protein